jgi:hypothetical protein
MKQAKWAQDYFGDNGPGRNQPPPEQVTFVGSPAPSPGSFQGTITGGSRYTGAGADGEIQPGKRAGEVHEGEGVLSADAMQAFSDEEFYALLRAAGEGNIDKNSFRQSVGLPPIQQFQSGGIMNNDLVMKDLMIKDPPNFTTNQGAAQGRAAGMAGSSASQGASITGQAGQQANALSVLNASNVASSQATPPPLPPVAPPASTPETVTIQGPAPVAPLPNPTTAPPPLNTTPKYDFDQGIQYGYDSIHKTAQGLNPLDKQIADRTLGDLEARNQWGTLAAQQDMSHLTPEARAALGGEMSAIGSSQVARTAGDLALAGRERAEGAARNLVDYGLRAQDQQARLDENTARTAALMSGQIQDRIATLSASMTPDAMKNDTHLREMIAKQLGPNATTDQISAEIDAQWHAFNDQNKSSFGGNIATLLGDLVENRGSVEDALGDASIRRNVAGFMGLGDTPENQQRIDDEIRKRFEMTSRDDLTVAYDNIVGSGMVREDYMNQPGFEDEMRNTIRDLYMKGILDKEGNIVSDAAFDWPWEDPGTFRNYRDWNGNQIAGGEYDGAAAVTVKGNGTDYAKADGSAVTQADLDAVWSQLSAGEREELFSGGIDGVSQNLMDKYFHTTLGPDGKPRHVTTFNEFQDWALEAKNATRVLELAENWSSPSTGKELDDEGNVIGENAFVWYDTYGNQQISNKNEPILSYVWKQLSDKFSTDGELLDEAGFNSRWNDGKGWHLDSDGRITNIDTYKSNPVLEQRANESYSSWESGSILTTSEAASIASNWDNLPEDKKATGTDFLEHYPTVYWDKTNWVMHSNVEDWVIENQGQLYKAADGRVYEIAGMVRPYKRKTTAYVKLIDIETGNEVKYSDGTGRSEKMPFGGEPYAV